MRFGVCKLVKVVSGLSRISVPNFTTFYCMVVWAAIDFQRRGIIIIIIGKTSKTRGCLAASLLGPQI